MTKNIKLGFTKSKAYGLCGVILSTALFTLFTVPVLADENNTASQPNTELIVDNTSNVTEDSNALSTKETEVLKEGDNIIVKNPQVDLHFEENGKGKYNNFKVEYKDVKFPDSMAVNEGDKIVFNMPKEISFRTDFDFDVKNPSNETIGHAQASVEKGTVTTVFNDYFSKNPLNKEMSMTFDAKWTEEVKSGEITRPNFDGTIKEVEIAKEAELDPGTEKFSKWGYQDSNDAQTLNWTVRFNLAKARLENTILKDRWSSNQEFVPDSLEIRTVEDVKSWTGDKSAQEYLESFHVLNGGFDLKLKTLQKLVYINYKTRLKEPVKASNDPVNAVWLTANNSDKLADNYRATISLVGGKGKASGESDNIPTPTPDPVIPPSETDSEKPKEIPKVEEKPKETPKVEEKPKETPKVEEKPKETPKAEEKPKEIPKVEEKPKEIPKAEEKPKETPKVEEKPKETPKAEEKAKETNTKVLPKTGVKNNPMIAILGTLCFMFGIKLKRTKN